MVKNNGAPLILSELQTLAPFVWPMILFVFLIFGGLGFLLGMWFL